MQGKKVLITGATNGIGKATALALAKMGPELIIVGRDPDRTVATVGEIKAASGNSAVEMLLADLSSMNEVRRLAGEFQAKYSQLDVLINNAGAVFAKRQETVDGYEMTFALNHLSYFLLTNLLIDNLKRASSARIVNVSSGAHTGGHIDFDDLQSKKSYGMQGFRPYSNSKLANVLFTYELARRLAGSTVTANALEPGVVATGFGHNNRGLISWATSLAQRFGKTAAQGAETIIYLASSPEVQVVSGKYFDNCKPVASSPELQDPAIAKRLWEESAKLTGLATTI